MRAPVRILAVLSVFGAAVAALIALPHPAARVERQAVTASAPSAPLVEAERSAWTDKVRPSLEAMPIPIRGKELEALLRTVDRSARRFGIDPVAVLAIIEVESQFDPLAVSPRGAMGLMQLRADTARELAGLLGIPWASDEMLLDPDVNVLLGTFYLSRLSRRFGDLDDVFTAFHLGPARVQDSKGQGQSVSLDYAHQVWDAVLHFAVRAIA
jgi:soluble lytic murein transglycosylase-like protein